MASMTIRNIDDQLKKQLRIQAARNGCSMEEEVRDILRAALAKSEQKTGAMMLRRIREIVEPLGGMDDLEIPPREPIPAPPRF